MTAEDVKFSMDYAMNPKNGAIGFLVLSVVGKVEVIDSYTLRVSTEKPSPAFLSLLTTNKTFPVVPKGALLEGIDKITTFPPGTGPFRFAEWKPGQRVVLDRYGNFWGRKAFVDRLILRPIRQDTVRFTAFRAGDVDMIQQVPLEWVKEIVDGKLKGIQYATASHSQFLGGDFNVAQPPFNNKKLRQAVAHAINRREILAAGHFGFGEATEQRYPKDHQWYVKDVPTPLLDFDRARALLKEAGYRGETIELMVEPLQERQAVATALQAQLKKIGMNVKLDVIEGGAYRARERAGDFAFKFTGGGIKPDPIHIFSRFKCEPDTKKRASNMTGYCDPYMDKLLDRLETETNPDRRAAIFREIVIKIQEDVPELNFGFVPTFYAFREFVRGFTTDSEANYYWWGGGLNHTWLDK
jgi:peptide/nickel transport system substrate-binding protein